jgi:putative nucleotidyltransferase with HDIG domain
MMIWFPRASNHLAGNPTKWVEAYHIVMLARYTIVNELEKGNAEFTQGLMNEVQQKTAELTKALDLLTQAYDDTIEALGSTLELKDAETEAHCQRVTAYTISIAKNVPVPLPYLTVLARAAFLHDIGKMAIPDKILRKPGPLDDSEKQIMRIHCEIGYNTLTRIPFLREAAEIVLAHQEFFDGSGYPRQLRGEQIPLGARIISIANSLDAHAERLALSQCSSDVTRTRGDSPLCRHAIRSQDCGGVSLHSRKPLD